MPPSSGYPITSTDSPASKTAPYPSPRRAFPWSERPQAAPASLAVVSAEIVPKIDTFQHESYQKQTFASRASCQSLNGPSLVRRADSCYASPDTSTIPHDGRSVLVASGIVLMTSPGQRSRSSHDQAAIVRGLETKLHTITFTKWFSPHEQQDGN